MTKPKGLHCPAPTCQSTHLRVLSVRRPCPGKKVRHLRCTACGTRMKSTEVLSIKKPAPK